MKIINKFLLAVALCITLAWLALSFTPSVAAKGACSMTDVCPTHGIEAMFSGQTRMASGGCIYGQYKHGSCAHWALCYCPGE